MSGRRWVTRSASFVACAVLLLLAGGGGASGGTDGSPDSAATPAGTAGNRAVIVIDDGTQRTATCVRFGEPSISGLDALRRSGAAVVDQAFGAMGGAVCSINGIGCPLTGCLTCQAPAYWNYFRAVGGVGFARSGAGASTAKVRDGDVEGWAWGANPAAPPLPSVDAVCGPRPAPPAPPPVAPPGPAAPNPAAPAPGGPGGAGPGASDERGDSANPYLSFPDATTTMAPDGDTTTTTGGGADAGDDDEGDDGLEILDPEELAAAGAATSDDGGTTPWWSIAAFAAIAAALGGWFLVVRRQRSASP